MSFFCSLAKLYMQINSIVKNQSMFGIQHRMRFFDLILSIFLALKNAVGFSYATPILCLCYAYPTPMLRRGA